MHGGGIGGRACHGDAVPIAASVVLAVVWIGLTSWENRRILLHVNADVKCGRSIHTRQTRIRIEQAFPARTPMTCVDPDHLTIAALNDEPNESSSYSVSSYASSKTGSGILRTIVRLATSIADAVCETICPVLC